MKHTQLADAVRHASEQGLLRTVPNEELSGFSGARIIGLMQRLVQSLDARRECYLEVGVYQGLTLLSVAMANRDAACLGIDNFAFFDHDGKNFAIVEKRRAALGLLNAEVINADYEEAFENLEHWLRGLQIGVYFVDGPHDYRSQLMCLQLAVPYLSDGAVIIVDDSNYRHVRQANRDFLATRPGFRLVFEAYTCAHPGNMDADQMRAARDGWWNGVNVILSGATDDVPRTYPPTHRCRGLYENEHLVHGSRAARLAPELVSFASVLRPFEPLRCVRRLGRLARKLGSRSPKEQAVFRDNNTYSATLPGWHLVGEGYAAPRAGPEHSRSASGS